MRFKLRFPLHQLEGLASRYSYAAGEARIEDVTAPAARGRGHLTKPEFLALCEWKTPRTRSRCASNPEDFVIAVTGTALSSPNDRLRIEVLTLLSGVSWPTASVILHFCARDPYPILDFRALWSVSATAPAQPDYELWAAYTSFTRALAVRAEVSMRALDRALWQYSKENQPAS